MTIVHLGKAGKIIIKRAPSTSGNILWYAEGVYMTLDARKFYRAKGYPTYTKTEEGLINYALDFRKHYLGPMDAFVALGSPGAGVEHIGEPENAQHST